MSGLSLGWVAAGGALGAVLRYLVSLASTSRFGEGFPYGTLAANLLGCAVIGLVASSLSGEEGLRVQLRLFVLVGLLGGFTTFSSFGLETVRLFEEGRWSAAFAYVVASNLGGLLACWAALRVAR